ncbi:E3 ubiquitin-protein ligase MARCH3 [Fukomys damarensis]|uniref:E3 ubiquitin-protein ligase MARCHF3 n=1 Tax=Fukomys damarensis TaxID=885580 RepID=A0A091DLP9_FUKDA|nr:E3 ubiquitin-protein ligase MARCH3 [Fukomys damarensis]
MTTSRCSHLPEVLPDCTSSAAPVVKTVEDCGSLVNGQPQYVMQVSAKDGQLLSTVVRTLATQSPFNDRPMCRICHEGSSQEDLLSPCECTGTLGTIHRSCLEHWLSSSNTSYCELCHFRFAVERKPRPLVEAALICCLETELQGGQSGRRKTAACSPMAVTRTVMGSVMVAAQRKQLQLCQFASKLHFSQPTDACCK